VASNQNHHAFVLMLENCSLDQMLANEQVLHSRFARVGIKLSYRGRVKFT
jgi:hypothetical protein